MILPHLLKCFTKPQHFTRFLSLPILLFSSNLSNSPIHFSSSSHKPDINPLLSNADFSSIFDPKFPPNSQTKSIFSLSHPQICTLENSSETELTSEAEKIYQTIIETTNSGEILEKSLDSLRTEITAEIVDDVLKRLQYEEKLAFRFFTWAGYQNRFEHKAHTYNFMIDILSNTKYKSRQFGVLCEILDQMKRIKKNPLPVNVLISILRDYTEKHLTHLRKFVKKKRIKMKTPPETDALNILLDSLCKCCLVTEAELIFNRVKKKILPNSETYNILFFGWCRVKDPNHAIKLLDEMIQAGYNPDNFTYNCAIDTFCNSGMVKEAHKLFDFMCTKGSTISSPTAKTYSLMIIALAKSNMMEESFTLLSQMKNTGCLPDVSTYKEIIEGMCLAGKIEAAYKVLDEMFHTGFPPDILTYNCFLKVLCNLHKSEDAINLFDKMTYSGCEPSIHTYNTLLTMFFQMNQPDRAIDIFHEMEKRNCKLVVETYSLMVDGLFGSKREKEACDLLNEVMDKGMKLPYRKFDEIMERLTAVGDLRAIHKLSEYMRRFYNKAMARRFSITQKKMSMGRRRY